MFDPWVGLGTSGRKGERQRAHTVAAGRWENSVEQGFPKHVLRTAVIRVTVGAREEGRYFRATLDLTNPNL